MKKNYHENMLEHKKTREHEIINTSAIGIVGSLILAIFEITVGIFANSIAIILDGLETISTALGSVVIIIGIKLSSKAPDKKHPLGYGRIEYVSDMVVASIIIYVGITGFATEIKAIITSQLPSYTAASYIVLVISMITKFYLAMHEKEMSKKLLSRSLSGIAVDSFANSFISMSIIISAIIYVKLGKNIENYIGLIISIVIIRGGLMIFRETLNEILGKRIHSNLIDDIKLTIMKFENVRAVYDFVLHSYGRDKYIGSVHIEVDYKIDILELEELQREITQVVYLKNEVVITAVGIYVVNSDDEDYMRIYDYINTFKENYRDVEEVHGLYLNKEKKEIHFDIVLDCKVENKDLMIAGFKTEIEDEYRDYEVFIQRDIPL